MGLAVRPSTLDDLSAVRVVRLEALLNHPAAFNAAHEVEVAQPDEFWRERVVPTDRQALFLAELDGELVGMCGVRLGDPPKRSHSAGAWGLYARPAAWGHDVSGQVLTACIEWAKGAGAVLIRCSSNADNLPSIRACMRCGFKVYGVEPSATQIDGVVHDDLLMWRSLGTSS